VRYTQFLDRGDVWLLKQEGPTRLTLITCSPADAQHPSRVQRYAVSAYALDGADAGAEYAAYPLF
jgi:hypothetical protein